MLNIDVYIGYTPCLYWRLFIKMLFTYSAIGSSTGGPEGTQAPLLKNKLFFLLNLGVKL